MAAVETMPLAVLLTPYKWRLLLAVKVAAIVIALAVATAALPLPGVMAPVVLSTLPPIEVPTDKFKPAVVSAIKLDRPAPELSMVMFLAEMVLAATWFIFPPID